MSSSIFIRIVLPSSYKVLKTIGTATQNYVRNHFSSNIIPSSHLVSKQERRMISQNSESQQMTKSTEDLTVDYNYVKNAITKGTLIIDVREPEEVKEHGKIPNSINIPLANVGPVLSNLSEKEFQDIYERIKPTPESEMIFYCMIGKRSGKAQQNALSLGFKKAKNYVGSWTDWATKIQ